MLPDSITFDRCYMHGTPTIDIQHGMVMMGSNYAVVDSDIDEIHYQGADSQAITAYNTPGPLKITNNLLVAAGENLFLGGAGGQFQPLRRVGCGNPATTTSINLCRGCRCRSQAKW